MKIETFEERRKVGDIFDKYFNPLNEDYLGDVFEDVLSFGAEEDIPNIDKIGNNLWEAMVEFDKTMYNDKETV